MKLTKYIVLIGAVCAAFTLQPAKADFISFLNVGNPAISGFTGPYGTVDIVLVNSTTATATFTSLTNSGNIYLFGDGGSVALNVNADTFTVSGITGSNSGTGFTPGPYSQGAAGNEDGFGSFNLTINSFDGFTHSSDTISFTVTNTSGTWASDADVIVFNSDGFDAAAHIFVTSFPADAANGALATGFAAEGEGNHVVPDGGATAALLGLGLAGLAGLRAKFGKN
jgi:protein with PEP-CTERM/exosortase system signal